MDAFEIDQDDLEFALNPHSRRRKLTKEQQLYGIWADEDEAENEKRYFGSSVKAKRNFASKSVTAPIGFVSGGLAKPAEEFDEKESENIPFSDDEYEANEQFETTLSQKARNDIQSNKQPKKFVNFYEREETEQSTKIGDWERHTKGIGQKLLLQMGYQSGKGLGKHGQGRTQPVLAVKRKGKGAIGAYGPEIPASAVNDEQTEHAFTRSDGKATAVQAKKGRNWRKGHDVDDAKELTIDDNDNRAMRQDEENLPLTNLLPFWAASGSKSISQLKNEQMQNVKVIDMTGKETKILTGYDSIANRMTRPDEQNYAEKNALNYAEDKPQHRFFNMPSLLHNLDALIRQSNTALSTNRKRLAYEVQQNEALQEKRERLQESLTTVQNELDRLEQLTSFIDNLASNDSQKGVDIEYGSDMNRNNTKHFKNVENCKELILAFKTQFQTELKLYDLKHIITTIVYPMFTDLLEGWNPLDDPTYALDIIVEWKSILHDFELDVKLETQANLDIYGDYTTQYGMRDNALLMKDDHFEDVTFQKMLWHIWLPKLRKTIQSEWVIETTSNTDQNKSNNGNKNLSTTEALIECLSVWSEFLPNWLNVYIRQNLILPKLMHHLENVWDPTKDVIPVHVWVHPWLPFLDPELVEFHISPTIRAKLGSALTAGWRPADKSARAMLLPWVTATTGQLDVSGHEDGESRDSWAIFSPRETETFLMRYIMPKLADLAHTKLNSPPGTKSNLVEQSLLMPTDAMLQHINEWSTNEWLWILDWADVFDSYAEHTSKFNATTISSNYNSIAKNTPILGGLSHLSTLLQATLFPLMNRVLSTALTHIRFNSDNDIDLMTISEWYQKWKDIFPQRLISRPEIKAQFDSLLLLINNHLTALENNIPLTASIPTNQFYHAGSNLLPTSANEYGISQGYGVPSLHSVYLPQTSPILITSGQTVLDTRIPPPPPLAPPPPRSFQQQNFASPFFPTLNLGGYSNINVKANTTYPSSQNQPLNLNTVTLNNFDSHASSFKEFVRERLENSGISMVPFNASTMYHLQLPANKSIYKAFCTNSRSCLMYFERDVIFVYQPGLTYKSEAMAWKPISPQELIKMLT